MIKTVIFKECDKVACIYDENKKITELVLEEKEGYKIGDIYIGIVETILSSINAAFINLNHVENNGFIHIRNLGHLKKKRNKKSVTAHLLCNNVIMVQVIKAPTRKKGPTVTGEISLKGRYLSLFPFKNKIAFEKDSKINKSTSCFITLLFLIKPKDLGILVGRKANSVTLDKVVQDFYALLHKWDRICRNFKSGSIPRRLHQNQDFVYNVLRETYTKEIAEIIIDSETGSNKAAALVTKWTTNTKLPLLIKYFQSYNFFICEYELDRVVYNLLQPRVNLVGGGYIIIERTEAITTIDVNSGSFNYFNNPRETMLLVNRKASKQIARHLKLRNIAGVIIIDFIDMENQQDQFELLAYFDSFLRQDEHKPRIVQFSELGLVELTRRRRYKSLKENFDAKLKNVFRSGNVTSISKVLSKTSIGHTLFVEIKKQYSS